jgi:hypothetical protein
MSREFRTDTLHCTAGQLRSLLAMAVDRPGAYGSLLARARDVAEIERLLAGSGAAERETSMLAALAARGTSLAEVRAIRDLAKGLIDRVGSDAAREAAAFVYHAATAAALGRHGCNLSSVPAQTRLPLFEDLATALGAHPLADVFRDAVDYVASSDV